MEWIRCHKGFNWTWFEQNYVAFSFLWHRQKDDNSFFTRLEIKENFATDKSRFDFFVESKQNKSKGHLDKQAIWWDLFVEGWEWFRRSGWASGWEWFRIPSADLSSLNIFCTIHVIFSDSKLNKRLCHHLLSQSSNSYYNILINVSYDQILFLTSCKSEKFL